MRYRQTVTARTDNDAGKDWQHREGTRRQGQQHAKTEETRGNPPERRVGQHPSDAPGLIAVYWHTAWIRQLNRNLLLLRWIAHPHIGTPLRSNLQDQRQHSRAVPLHRQANKYFAVEDLNVAEGFVDLLLASRKRRHAQLDTIRFDGKTELIAVQVVAIGNGEAHFDRPPVERTRRGLERLGGVQEIGGPGQTSRHPQQNKNEETRHAESQLSSSVSANTQAKYSGKPRVTGTATISGSSYGCCSRIATCNAG